ncbi:MAG: hypothetical protein FJ318_10615 [SAR202 cluster bacterium]|nr:hypothetical protein [SAR202 cluster bacterium]
MEQTFAIWTSDEPAAGLPGERADVTLYVRDEEHGQDARRSLAQCFAAIWGVSVREVHVATAAEMG